MTKLLAVTPNYAGSVYRTADPSDRIFAPTTAQVLEASVEDVFEGVGSYRHQGASQEVIMAGFKGNKITSEEYQQSDYYRPSIGHFTNMTDEQAKLLADHYDSSEARNEILGKASTGQTALGIGAALVTGVAEPRNLMFGALTFGAGTVAGNATRAGSRINKILNARRVNAGYAAKAGLGAAEGMVAAAAMEPGNRYAAEILQDDYTLMDSLFNVATSTILGAGFETAPKFIKDRFMRNPSKAMDITTRELDVAVEQLATGQRIDVTLVERAFDGEISKKPLVEKTRAVIEHMEATGRSILPKEDVAVKPDDLTVDKTVAAKPVEWQQDLSPHVVEDLQNPASWVIRDKITGKAIMETTQADVAAKVNTKKYEAVPAIEYLANLNGRTYKQGVNALKQAQKVQRAAFDGESIDAVAARIDSENAASFQSYTKEQLDPNNDTAIDVLAVNWLEDRLEQLALQKHIDELGRLDAYTKDIEAMREVGAIDEADYNAMLQAFDEMDEDNLQSAWEAARICMTRG